MKEAKNRQELKEETLGFLKTIIDDMVNDKIEITNLSLKAQTETLYSGGVGIASHNGHYDIVLSLYDDSLNKVGK